MRAITLAGLTFQLRRSAKRRTLEIVVERDGSLLLLAPKEMPEEALERAVRQEMPRIHARLAEKEELAQPFRPKEYVPGEGFYYLGRSYRLRLVEGDSARSVLRLYRGFFELRRDAQYQGREHFVRWYTAQLQRCLPEQLAALALRLGVECPPFRVRELGYRWGSHGRRGELYFHWRVVLLPHSLIEYVSAHELVHLVEPRHSAAFWERLERTIPDYRQRSRWLAEHGAKYAL